MQPGRLQQNASYGALTERTTERKTERTTDGAQDAPLDAARDAPLDAAQIGLRETPRLASFFVHCRQVRLSRPTGGYCDLTGDCNQGQVRSHQGRTMQPGS